MQASFRVRSGTLIGMAWLVLLAWWLQGWQKAAWLAAFATAGLALSRPLGRWLVRRAAGRPPGEGMLGSAVLAWSELPGLLDESQRIVGAVRGPVWKPSTWGEILDRWVDLLAERVRRHVLK